MFLFRWNFSFGLDYDFERILFFKNYFISASLLHSEVRQEHFLHNTPQSDRLNVILILTVAVELGDFWIGNPQTPIAGYDEDDRNTQLNIFSSKLSNKN